MSNNKQSSIDILCGKLAMKLGIPQAITFYIDHQEEIEEAHNQGYGSGMIDDQITPKQYYNETFGGGEQ